MIRPNILQTYTVTPLC